MRPCKQIVIKKIKNLMNLYGLTIDDLKIDSTDTQKQFVTAETNDDDDFGGAEVDPSFFERYKDIEIPVTINEESSSNQQNQDLTNNMSDINMNVDESLVDDNFGGN